MMRWYRQLKSSLVENKDLFILYIQYCGCWWQCKKSAWWCHQMETFSTLLTLCAENSLVTGEFPAQRPVTWSFDVFFDLRLNKRLSKQSGGCWFETPCHGNEDIVCPEYSSFRTGRVKISKLLGTNLIQRTPSGTISVKKVPIILQCCDMAFMSFQKIMSS